MYNPADHYWRVAGNPDQVYSSIRAIYVALSDATFVEWCAGLENVVTPIDTFDNLIAVLRDANVPPYHRVRKSTVIYRLNDAQLAAAYAALNSTLRLRERWYAPDQGYINADDTDSRNLLTAIGVNPDEILAPE